MSRRDSDWSSDDSAGSESDSEREDSPEVLKPKSSCRRAVRKSSASIDEDKASKERSRSKHPKATGSDERTDSKPSGRGSQGGPKVDQAFLDWFGSNGKSGESEGDTKKSGRAKKSKSTGRKGTGKTRSKSTDSKKSPRSAKSGRPRTARKRTASKRSTKRKTQKSPSRSRTRSAKGPRGRKRSGSSKDSRGRRSTAKSSSGSRQKSSPRTKTKRATRTKTSRAKCSPKERDSSDESFASRKRGPSKKTSRKRTAAKAKKASRERNSSEESNTTRKKTSRKVAKDSSGEEESPSRKRAETKTKKAKKGTSRGRSVSNTRASSKVSGNTKASTKKGGAKERSSSSSDERSSSSDGRKTKASTTRSKTKAGKSKTRKSDKESNEKPKTKEAKVTKKSESKGSKAGKGKDDEENDSDNESDDSESDDSEPEEERDSRGGRTRKRASTVSRSRSRSSSPIRSESPESGGRSKSVKRAKTTSGKGKMRSSKGSKSPRGKGKGTRKTSRSRGGSKTKKAGSSKTRKSSGSTKKGILRKRTNKGTPSSKTVKFTTKDVTWDKLTIPDGIDTGISLDEFVVRLLSTDHQHGFNVDFELVDDSQELLTLSEEGLFAYVHHFTLYDSYARGYVRPFCLAYVSPDERKLSSNFVEMSKGFSKISELFKDGNLLVFCQDITNYLSDLRYTRDKLLEWEARISERSAESSDQGDSVDEDDEVLGTISLVEVDKCITEAEDILNSLTALVRSLLISFNPNYALEPRTHSLDKRSDRCFGLLLNSRNKTSNIGQTPLDQENFKLSKIIHELQGASPDDSSSSSEDGSQGISRISQFLDSYDSYKPELRSAGRRTVQKTLRNLDELCRKSASDAIEQLNSLHKFFKRDHSTLLMEKEDLRNLDPACSLLTIGRTIHLNFVSGFTSKSSGKCPMSHAESCSVVCSPNSASSAKLTPFEEAQSFCTCSSVDSFESCLSEPDKCDSSSNVVSCSEEFKDSPLSNLPANDESSDNKNHSATSSDVLLRTRPQKLDVFEDVKRKRCTQVNEISVISVADHVENLSESSLGSGILNVLTQYSFSTHLMFSLLSGRPVVVQGSQVHQIEDVVRALWILVPGYTKNSVVTCSKTEPDISVLKRIKLYGYLKNIDKRSNIGAMRGVNESLTTVLNLDRRTLSAPKYKGTVLSEICNMKNCYTTDEAFIAYLHSKLNDLAMKAYLYFHAFSIKKSANMAERIEDVEVQEEWEDASLVMCNKMELKNDDAIISQNLVTVVTMQQRQELINQDAPSNDNTSPVKIALSERKSYRFT